MRCLPEHLQGIVGYRPADTEGTLEPSEIVATLPSAAVPPADLQRDLIEYEAVVGGGW